MYDVLSFYFFIKNALKPIKKKDKKIKNENLIIDRRDIVPVHYIRNFTGFCASSEECLLLVSNYSK